jgi:hypothetical protein
MTRVQPAALVVAQVVSVATHSGWDRFFDHARDIARDVGEAALGVAILWLFLAFVYSRIRRRLRIGDFVGAADAESKVTATSAEFTALVSTRIHAIASAQPGGRVDLAAPSGGPVAIPATVTKAVPQARLVDALIELVAYLLPPNERKLSGTLLSSSPQGVGVAVSLSSRWGGPHASMTIWAADLPVLAWVGEDASSYRSFVIPVAAWTLAHFRPRRFAGLGTTDPLSYAAFDIAASFQGATA